MAMDAGMTEESDISQYAEMLEQAEFEEWTCWSNAQEDNARAEAEHVAEESDGA